MQFSTLASYQMIIFSIYIINIIILSVFLEREDWNNLVHIWIIIYISNSIYINEMIIYIYSAGVFFTHLHFE